MGFSFDVAEYGPVVAELVDAERLPEMGPGHTSRNVADRLSGVRAEDLFAGRPVRDRQMAACCLSALWLHQDFLDESHRISQSIETPSGSYWHGIMHRREPDYSNAKYWFRRVGDHPIYDPLFAAARQAAAHVLPGGDLPEASLAAWDSFLFVDWCQRASRSDSPLAHWCRLVARAEWQLLFDYCYRAAI